MNVFKALSQGNGNISETNLTSFLSYLLNNTTEMGNIFLLQFLTLLDTALKPISILEDLKVNKISPRNQLRIFNENYSFISIPEFRVDKGENSQVIDVFLKIADKSGENDIAYFLIENKIRENSKNDGQAKKQYEYFSSSDDMQTGAAIYSVLLTPNSDSFKPMFDEVTKVNKNSCWIKWTDIFGSPSVELAIKNMIQLENQAEIQPIDPSTKFLLKSFVDYISTELTPVKKNSVRNSSYNGFEVVEVVSVEVEKRILFIKRFENGMIRIFNVMDGLIDEPIKPQLRRINDFLNLQINLKMENGKKKNTQVLGKEIIRAIRWRNSK